MNNIKTFIKLLRAKQWIKNIFVLAGIVFAGMATQLSAWVITAYAVLAFCLASSGIYIFNDIMDKKEDSLHPEKRTRPIASGDVSVPLAAFIMAALSAAAAAVAFLLIGFWFFVCVAGYIVVMILYSVKLKQVVIVDVMILAAGFVVRAVGGVVALSVKISPWLILCTALLSLYLALNKRRGEMEKMGESGMTRSVLKKYSVDSLKEMLSVVTPSIVVAYAIYTFFSPVGPIMMTTLPFVVFGIFRYIYIADRKQRHDAPEMALLTDIPLMADIALWGILSAVLIFLG